MLISVIMRWCAEPMNQHIRLKINVKIKGHGVTVEARQKTGNMHIPIRLYS